MSDVNDYGRPIIAEGPHAHLARLATGWWRYRWWDHGRDYLRGLEPDREEVKPSLQLLLPMLLADHARAQLTAELRGPETQV